MGGGPKCKKCFKMTYECQTCKGKGCSVCANTGRMCPQHGKFWS